MDARDFAAFLLWGRPADMIMEKDGAPAVPGSGGKAEAGKQNKSDHLSNGLQKKGYSPIFCRCAAVCQEIMTRKEISIGGTMLGIISAASFLGKGDRSPRTNPDW
jgi:hypothetical protein